MVDWKFKKIQENMRCDKGKTLEPLYFESSLDESSYETIEVFMICYNKIVTRPLFAIRRNTVPPYDFTIVVKGDFELIDDPKKLEGFIKKEYKSRIPKDFHDNLEVKVSSNRSPITIQIKIY